MEENKTKVWTDEELDDILGNMREDKLINELESAEEHDTRLKDDSPEKPLTE